MEHPELNGSHVSSEEVGDQDGLPEASDVEEISKDLDENAAPSPTTTDVEEIDQDLDGNAAPPPIALEQEPNGKRVRLRRFLSGGPQSFLGEWILIHVITVFLVGLMSFGLQKYYENERARDQDATEEAYRRDQAELQKTLAQNQAALQRVLSRSQAELQKSLSELAEKGRLADAELAKEQFDAAQRLENLRSVRAAILEPDKLNARRFNYLDLAGMHLEEYDLAVSRLYNANLSGAYLDFAVMNGAQIVKTELIGAHLNHSFFVNAILWGSNFTDADLTAANFTGADLSNVIFTGATITDETTFTNYSCAAGSPTWPEGFEPPASEFCQA